MITRKLKQLVWKRDAHRCHYCRTCCRDFPTVDHFVPKALGGKDNIENLVTACLDCNREKADRLPDQFVAKKMPNAGRRKKRKANPADAAIRERREQRKLAERRAM